MNLNEKDNEFFYKFEDDEYVDILSKFKSIQNEYELENTNYEPNGHKIDSIRQKMQNFVNPNRMYDIVYSEFDNSILSVLLAKNISFMSEPNLNCKLLPETQVLRQKLTSTYGYIIPSIKFIDSNIIENYGYAIQVRGKKVCSDIILEKDLEQNNPREIIKSLYKVCFDYAHYIITKVDILKLMELVRSQDPTPVNDIIPTYICPIDLKHIFANLIQRKVSIKDILLVFEILNEHVRYTRDVNELTDIMEKELSFFK